MKRPIFVPLLAALAFAGCETAHKAAVSTYRVVAAPVTYVGHKLGVDEENQQTTTTGTSVQSGTAMANPPAQPYPAHQPTPPPPCTGPKPAPGRYRRATAATPAQAASDRHSARRKK